MTMCFTFLSLNFEKEVNNLSLKKWLKNNDLAFRKLILFSFQQEKCQLPGKIYYQAWPVSGSVAEPDCLSYLFLSPGYAVFKKRSGPKETYRAA